MSDPSSSTRPDGGAPELRPLRETVRPLIIDTGVPAFPVAICGSCFLAGHRSQMFVVTAAHLVRGILSSEVRVLPTGRAAKRLTLSQAIGRPASDGAAEVDLVAFPATSDDLSEDDLAIAQLVNVDTVSSRAWIDGAPVSQFALVGFPRQKNSVDYERERVMTAQVWVTGRYCGPLRGSRTIHTLAVDNPLGLDDFGGFSGAPVFSFEHRVAAAPVQRFCGVAVAGTPSSGLMHFVEAESVLELLQDALAHVQRFGLRLPRPL